MIVNIQKPIQYLGYNPAPDVSVLILGKQSSSLVPDILGKITIRFQKVDANSQYCIVKSAAFQIHRGFGQDSTYFFPGNIDVVDPFNFCVSSGYRFQCLRTSNCGGRCNQKALGSSPRFSTKADDAGK